MISAAEYERDLKYHDACRYYTAARDELSGAILASISVQTSVDLEQLQHDVDDAMEHMRAVCGKDDESF